MILGLRSWLRSIQKSTFFMNALYLMMSTFVTAGFGFLFWMIITRSYDASAVGLATTLLSVSGLLSLLGIVGFDTTFVRFLPRSNHKSDYISSGFTIVTFASCGLAICVGIALPFILPNLSLLSADGAFVAFVFFTVVSSLNVLITSVFVAFKRAFYVLIICLLLGASKITLPLLVNQGNAMTIFIVAGIAQLIGLGVGLVWMRRVLAYKFSVLFDTKVLHTVKKFSFSTYVASLLNLLPPTILPLLLINALGSASAAYYYMAFTIASALYTIAYASMQSAFAEGSHNRAAMRAHVLKAAKLVTVLLLPASLLVAILSSPLLELFGHKYASEASGLLQIFALGSLPVAAYSAMSAIFKVTKNLRGILCMNFVYSVAILGSAYWLMPHVGLVAVGWAWLIGNMAACFIGALFLVNNKKLGAPHGKITSTRR